MNHDAAPLPSSRPQRSDWGRILLWVVVGLLALLLVGAAIAYAYPWLAAGDAGFPAQSAR